MVRVTPYRGFAFQTKRQPVGATSPALPRRGFGIRAGSNKPRPTAWVTAEFAARYAEPHWMIFDWATGEPVGRAAEFQVEVRP